MGSGAAWVLGIIAVLVFYILSPGPVGKLIQSIAGTDPPEKYIRPCEILYLPLGLCAEHFEPVEHFYEWYLKLWGVEIF